MNRPTLTALLLSACTFAAATAPARADMLFVSVNNKIVQYDTTATNPTGTVFATTGVQPNEGLAFDSAGNLYVDMATTGAVLKYAPNGTGAPFAGFNGVGQGLAFDGAGNLFVADANNHLIREITPNGTVSVFGTLPGVPIGLAFDSSGNLYAASQSDNTIIKFGPGGGAGTVFATAGISVPLGLAFDSAGNLLVANAGNNTIAKVTPGGVSSIFANTNLNSPYGLAFDSSGNLFVVNQGNRTIERFNSAGVGTLFASDFGSDFPSFLAFRPAAVPEPSSLILCVLGAVGGLGRWRRRARQAA